MRTRHSKRKTGVVFALVVMLTVGSLVAVPPRQAEALDGGGSLALFGKEIADILGWIFGDKILSAISNQTIQWSNSGFGDLTISVDPSSLDTIRKFQGGDPAFLENPEEFFRGVGDDVSRYFIQELEVVAEDVFPAFRDEILRELAIDTQDSNSSFANRLSATITEEDMDRFIDDFASGGWGTFLELTESPQNYFDGALLAAQNELEQLKAEEIERNQSDLEQSGGFLSIRRCAMTKDRYASENNIDSPQLRAAIEADAQGCVSYENVTPGKLIGDKVTSALQSDTNRTQAADEITEVIALLVTRILDSLIEEGFSELASSLGDRSGFPQSTAAVEAEGERQLAEQRGELYRSQNDGTGDTPPPPASPASDEGDDTTPPNNTPTISINRKGSYWTELSWNKVNDDTGEPAEGYIIYRFEDKPRPQDNGDGIDPPNDEFDSDDENKQPIATKSFENNTLIGSEEYTYTDSGLKPDTRYGYSIIAFDERHNRTNESGYTFATTEEDDANDFEETLDLLPIMRPMDSEEESCFTIVEGRGWPGQDAARTVCEYEVGAYWVSLNEDGQVEYVDSEEVPEFLVYYGLETSGDGARWSVVEGSEGVLRYGGSGNLENGAVEKLILDSLAIEDQEIRMRAFIKVDTTNKVNETNEGNNNMNREHRASESFEE